MVGWRQPTWRVPKGDLRAPAQRPPALSHARAIPCATASGRLRPRGGPVSRKDRAGRRAHGGRPSARRGWARPCAVAFSASTIRSGVGSAALSTRAAVPSPRQAPPAAARLDAGTADDRRRRRRPGRADHARHRGAAASRALGAFARPVPWVRRLYRRTALRRAAGSAVRHPHVRPAARSDPARRTLACPATGGDRGTAGRRDPRRDPHVADCPALAAAARATPTCCASPAPWWTTRPSGAAWITGSAGRPSGPARRAGISSAGRVLPLPRGASASGRSGHMPAGDVPVTRIAGAGFLHAEYVYFAVPAHVPRDAGGLPAAVRDLPTRHSGTVVTWVFAITSRDQVLPPASSRTTRNTAVAGVSGWRVGTGAKSPLPRLCRRYRTRRPR